MKKTQNTAQKKTSSRAKLKKLLAPIRYDKKNWGIYFLTQLFKVFQAIFIVQIVALIIGAVEEGNTEKLYYYVWWRGGVVVIILISSWLESISHDSVFMTIRSYLTQKYVQHFLSLDNTDVEGYGTGRVNNIIINGIQRSVVVVVDVLIASIVEILAIIYAFVLVAIQLSNWKYFLIFIGVFFLVIGCIALAFMVMYRYRKQAKLLNMEQDRRLVRFVMSKFEILQNNRLKQEQEIIHKLNMKEKKYPKSMT